MKKKKFYNLTDPKACPNLRNIFFKIFSSFLKQCCPYLQPKRNGKCSKNQNMNTIFCDVLIILCRSRIIGMIKCYIEICCILFCQLFFSIVAQGLGSVSFFLRIRIMLIRIRLKIKQGQKVVHKNVS